MSKEKNELLATYEVTGGRWHCRADAPVAKFVGMRPAVETKQQELKNQTATSLDKARAACAEVARMCGWN